MAEEFEIQTTSDLKTIDYMRVNNQIINNSLNEQIDTINTISDNLDILTESISADVNLSEINNKIDNINTEVVEEQTQDILVIVNNQQAQIDEIKNDMNSINDKLDRILEKI